MTPVEKLGHSFDHETLLKEFVSCQPSNTLPTTYVAMKVFGGTYAPRIINKCPYTIEVCEKVKQLGFEYNYVLFRLLHPLSTVSWHVDSDCRPFSFHIPVTTNEGCFYVYDYHAYPMQELGELYRVAVDNIHTAFNAGLTPRLHLHFIYDNAGNFTKGVYADRGVL